MSVLSLAVQFILFWAAQGLVFNALPLFELIRPHVFITLLLMLPARLPFWVLLLGGFVLGLAVDFVSLPLGAFAFCSVLIMALRYVWMLVITPSLNMVNLQEDMRLEEQTTGWLLTYAAPLVVIFELVYYTLVDLAFNWTTLLKALGGSLYTYAFVILLMVIFYKRGR
jgi:hypothetical protein